MTAVQAFDCVKQSNKVRHDPSVRRDPSVKYNWLKHCQMHSLAIKHLISLGPQSKLLSHHDFLKFFKVRCKVTVSLYRLV